MTPDGSLLVAAAPFRAAKGGKRGVLIAGMWQSFINKVTARIQPIVSRYGYVLESSSEIEERGGGHSLWYRLPDDSGAAISVSAQPRIHATAAGYEEFNWFRIHVGARNLDQLMGDDTLRDIYELGGWKYTTDAELDDRIEQAAALLERYFAEMM